MPDDPHFNKQEAEETQFPGLKDDAVRENDPAPGGSLMPEKMPPGIAAQEVKAGIRLPPRAEGAVAAGLFDLRGWHGAGGVWLSLAAAG